MFIKIGRFLNSNKKRKNWELLQALPTTNLCYILVKLWQPDLTTFLNIADFPFSLRARYILGPKYYFHDDLRSRLYFQQNTDPIKSLQIQIQNPAIYPGPKDLQRKVLLLHQQKLGPRTLTTLYTFMFTLSTFMFTLYTFMFPLFNYFT